MITDDEVMRLLEEADPGRAADISPVSDARSYLDTLRSTIDVPAVATVPTSIPPTRRRVRPVVAAVAAVTVLVLGAVALVSRDESGPPTRATPPTTSPDSYPANFFAAERAFSVQVKRICSAANDRYMSERAAAGIAAQMGQAQMELMARVLDETLPQLRALVPPDLIREAWETTYWLLAQLPNAWRNPNAVPGFPAIIGAIWDEFGVAGCTFDSGS
jgi:hypothetical protein